MKHRATPGILALILAVPCIGAAQNGGFVPGINPGWVHPVSPAVTGRIIQPFGIPRSHPGPQVIGGVHAIPHAIPQAPLVLVAPPVGNRTIPGTKRTASKRGRVTPRVSVDRDLGSPRSRRPGTTAIIPNTPGTFVSLPSLERPLSAGGTIVVGMPRADVFLHLGRPRATILDRHNETLVFTGTTVIIQNGVVALIR